LRFDQLACAEQLKVVVKWLALDCQEALKTSRAVASENQPF
jgi:hypothetical protein